MGGSFVPCLDQGCTVKTDCLQPVIALVTALITALAPAVAPAWATALAMACVPLASSAQVAVSAPAQTASAAAPLRTRPGPRLLTPAETRDSATQPGDVRPERPVTPQISIPLGKTPPAARTPEPIGAKRNRPAADARADAAARCEAQVGEQVRAKCRDRLAREARRP